MLHPRRNPLTYVALTATVFLSTGVQRARADERATIGIVGWATIASGLAGAVWLIDKAFGPDPTMPECTGSAVVTNGKAEIKKPDGTVISGEGEKVVLKEDGDDPVLTATVSMPDDYGLPLPLPATYQMAETATYTVDPGQGSVGCLLDAIDYYANVSDPAFGGDGTLWSVGREVTYRYLKPSGIPAGQHSKISIPIDLDGVSISTTDYVDTVASVEWKLDISVAELGGTVFSTRVAIGQGTLPLVEGNIPASAFTLAPGLAQIDGYHESFDIDVPETITTLTVTVTQSHRGEAYGLQTPPWGTNNAFKAGSTGVAKLVGHGPLSSNSSNVLDIVGAYPSTTGLLYFGDTIGSAPLLGGTFVPAGTVVFFGLNVLSQGEAHVPFNLRGIPPGLLFVLQYWFVDPDASHGVGSTNGLTGITP